jgi:hypothetical protein
VSYQAIVTKYLGATNFRGSRVKAMASAGSITLSWDHSLNSENNHTAAARALAVKYGWLVPNDPIGQTFSERYAIGGMPSASPYAYVFVDRGNK